MIIAKRVRLPDLTRALLFDMDGVLLDTLPMDYKIVQRYLGRHIASEQDLKNLVKANFGCSLADFWSNITQECNVKASPEVIATLVKLHEQLRQSEKAEIHEGISEILHDARNAGLKIAYVSNAASSEIYRMLRNVDVYRDGDHVIGNDPSRLRPKPAPDLYVEAIRTVGCRPNECVAMEDSLVGVEAAAVAGCHVIGVATGGTKSEVLFATGFPHQVYESFAESSIMASL